MDVLAFSLLDLIEFFGGDPALLFQSLTDYLGSAETASIIIEDVSLD